MSRSPNGRWIAIAVLVLGVSVAAAGVWWMRTARSHPGEWIDVLAIDDGAAVGVRAQQGGGNNYVTLVAADGAVRWDAMVPPYDAAPGAVGIAASPEAITVRVRRSGVSEVFGLWSRDSAKLGAFQLAVNRPLGDRPPVTGATTISDRTQSFEVIGVDREWAEVYATMLDDGKTTWRVDLGAAPFWGAWLRADHLVIAQQDRTRSIDRRTGKVVLEVTSGVTCVAGNELLALHGGLIDVLPLAGGKPRLVLEAPQAFSLMCGRRGDRLLVLEVARDAGGAAQGLAIAAFDAGTGARLGSAGGPGEMTDGALDLEPLIAMRAVDGDALPLGDDGAARIVVVVTDASGGTRVARLATGGGPAEVSAPAPELVGGLVLRDGERSFLHLPKAHLLVAFDGEGVISAAVELPADARSPLPHHLAGGRLWLVTASGLLVLDGATLRTVGAAGRAATALPDATARASALLAPR